MNDFVLSQFIIGTFFGPSFSVLSGGVIALILFILLTVSFRQLLPGVKSK